HREVRLQARRHPRETFLLHGPADAAFRAADHEGDGRPVAEDERAALAALAREPAARASRARGADTKSAAREGGLMGPLVRRDHGAAPFPARRLRAFRYRAACVRPRVINAREGRTSLLPVHRYRKGLHT